MTNIKNFNRNSITINDLKKSLKEWLIEYLNLNNRIRGSYKITPYIHVFVFHIPEMLKNHNQNIEKFNTQALERLNDFSTQYYRLCTNKKKKNLKYVKQLINKRQRIEFLNLKGHFSEFHQIESDSDDEDFNPNKEVEDDDDFDYDGQDEFSDFDFNL